MGRMGSDMWEKWVECREKTPRLLELPRAREARLPTRARLVEVEEDGEEAVARVARLSSARAVLARVEKVVVCSVMLVGQVAEYLDLWGVRVWGGGGLIGPVGEG